MAAAIDNLNSGTAIVFFSENSSNLQRIHASLVQLSDGDLGNVKPWGAFAEVGESDGLLMFFDGPRGGIIAHMAWSRRGELTLNNTIQKFMNPLTRVSEDGVIRREVDLYGLRVTPTDSKPGLT